MSYSARESIPAHAVARPPEPAAHWRLLDWDSEQFGFPAARLELVDPPSLAADVEACRRAGIEHLTARVDASQLDQVHALEAAGFEMIDGIITFGRPLDAVPPEAEGARLFQPPDLPEILAIARTAFVHDRFHADAALGPGAAARINETWTRNCCQGDAADAVIVAMVGGRLASYVTVKLDRANALGIIVLVATAPEARGQGAARTATLGSLGWFHGQGMRRARVGTQLRNIAAARLYESCGFRLEASSLTFRKRIPGAYHA